jgi:hypothetical protein
VVGAHPGVERGFVPGFRLPAKPLTFAGQSFDGMAECVLPDAILGCVWV